MSFLTSCGQLSANALYQIDMKSFDESVLLENSNFIYINKPAEITSEEIIAKYLQLHLIQRLDTNTTGVMALAKNAKSANMFRKFNTVKIYLTIVEGTFKQDYVKQNFHLVILKDRVLIKKSADSKACEQEIFCVARNEKFSCLLVKIISGRKHQIRAGMKALKHPLIGDQKYGNGKFFSRQALHALALKIEEDFVVAPLADKLCSALRSYCKLEEKDILIFFTKLKETEEW